MSKLSIGDKAPEFEAETYEGKPVRLNDYKDKKTVVLYFYPRDNTPGCTTQACDFTRDKDAFEDEDAIILGVSPDSPKKHRNFIEKKELKITLLADEEKELSNLFGIWQLKKFMGKEYMGVVRSTFIIDPEGKVAAVWSKVRVKGHVDAVKEKLQELQQ